MMIRKKPKYRGQNTIANPNSTIKQMLFYSDFSGGLNTSESSDLMSDSESKTLINVDLAERGATKRRNGMVSIGHTSLPTGKAQGYFRYMNKTTTVNIVAINGKLYNSTTGAVINITGLSSFQTTNPIEAVMYNNKLYIATGSGLVSYDGTTASLVTPYQPTGFEYMFLGANALSTSPSGFLKDGVGVALQLIYLVADTTKGWLGHTTTFTAYSNVPTGKTIEYKFSYKKEGEDDSQFVMLQDFSTSRSVSKLIYDLGIYEIQVLARVQGTTTPIEELRTSYEVTKTNENDPIKTYNMASCNRISLHANRLFMYGDVDNGTTLFISDLDNGEYFPMYSTFEFKNPQNQPITTILPFQNYLLVMTNYSVQALFGSSEEDFERVVMHTDVGCISPFSAAVVGNVAVFNSYEGIVAITPSSSLNDRMTIQKIDTTIQNIVPVNEKEAYGCFYDNQYHLVFPKTKTRFRYYLEFGAWVQDTSNYMDVVNPVTYDGILYSQISSSGKLVQFSDTVYKDIDHIYSSTIRTKDFDLSLPFHKKQLKQLHLLFADNLTVNPIGIKIFNDGNEIISDIDGFAQIVNGVVTWVEQPKNNIKISTSSILGTWQLGSSKFGGVTTNLVKMKLKGKANRTSIQILHQKDEPFTFLGMGYIYKVYKP